ncbi:hypothetical protein GN958_ATG21820 [Phytophthora infestans]|uniref:Uncharacterized protein n=1 Tax=Phytophthora infestans TaxID=4787 RepID=A0A8S9TQG3_PHYIN|nr:hypothetical protein GN958_ATG21820 [Phytophthora infestans]
MLVKRIDVPKNVKAIDGAGTTKIENAVKKAEAERVTWWNAIWHQAGKAFKKADGAESTKLEETLKKTASGENPKLENAVKKAGADNKFEPVRDEMAKAAKGKMEGILAKLKQQRKLTKAGEEEVKKTTEEVAELVKKGPGFPNMPYSIYSAAITPRQ